MSAEHYSKPPKTVIPQATAISPHGYPVARLYLLLRQSYELTILNPRLFFLSIPIPVLRRCIIYRSIHFFLAWRSSSQFWYKHDVLVLRLELYTNSNQIYRVTSPSFASCILDDFEL
jgi:hypothetical protein